MHLSLFFFFIFRIQIGTIQRVIKVPTCLNEITCAAGTNHEAAAEERKRVRLSSWQY